MIDTVQQCVSSMNILDWDPLKRALVIAPTVIISVGYGYYLAVRGNDKDVRDLKEAAFILMDKK